MKTLLRLSPDMHLRRCNACGTYWTNNANPAPTTINRICPNCVGNLPAVILRTEVA